MCLRGYRVPIHFGYHRDIGYPYNEHFGYKVAKCFKFYIFTQLEYMPPKDATANLETKSLSCKDITYVCS